MKWTKLFPALLLSLLVIIIVACWIWWSLPAGKLQIWYLDVGQGDAILARLPEGEWILTDGGPDAKVLEWLGKIMPFYDREIELMILTHPHADHINGLLEVLNRYQVNNLLLTGVEYDYVAYRQLQDLAKLKGVKIWYPQQRDFRIGKTALDIIYPQESWVGKHIANINNSSLVYRLISGKFIGFFSGDLEMEKEAELLKKPALNLNAQVLKAGHHGSKTSNTLDFLKRIRPQKVIVSCGAGNKFGHPFAGTLDNFRAIGATIFRTDLDGLIYLEGNLNAG